MSTPSQTLARLRRRAAEVRVPLQATLELTHRCNLGCAHCYLQGARCPAAAELSTAEWRRVLAELRDLQTLFLTLTGGELFVREDAAALLAHARSLGFALIVLTNGTLLGDAALRALEAAEPREVHVSLLGTEAVHDRLTGTPGSYRRARAAMDRLREAGLRVVAKLALTRPAVPTAEAARAAALAHADEVVTSVHLLPGVGEAQVPASLGLREADFLALPRPPSPVCDDDEPSLPPGSVCNAGRSLLAVGPDGTVYPCITFRRPAGSVRSTPLATIWDGPVLREVAALRAADLAACCGCADRAYCRFCPGYGWQAYGEMRRPTPELCARARAARRVRDGEGAP
jgi:radical SAM protein with 4Fe4S-binding SPASM domain